jgi:SAM-dependent methyltransferase
MPDMSTFRCHACGGVVEVLAAPALQSLASSDCLPVKGDIRVGVCGNCALLQKEVSAAWNSLCSKIYGNYQLYHQAAGREQKVLARATGEFKPRSELIADLLKDSYDLPRNGSLLDIGCGNGAFLRSMSQSFPEWTVAGADINDTYRDQILSIGPRATFKVTDELAASHDRYDVVALIHCLEHIPGPVKYLAEARRYIKPGGRLLIQVPDAERNPFDLVVADHASHFVKATVAAIVEAAGYKLITCGNDIVGKELTLLAHPLPDGAGHRLNSGQADAADVARSRLAWLEGMLQCGRRLAREARPLGIFGTSIAGVWIATSIDNKFDFYVDEDRARIGRDCFGVPILAPADIPPGSTVFVCLEPGLAANIAARYGGAGRRFVVPPPVASEDGQSPILAAG